MAKLEVFSFMVVLNHISLLNRLKFAVKACVVIHVVCDICSGPIVIEEKHGRGKSAKMTFCISNSRHPVTEFKNMIR